MLETRSHRYSRALERQLDYQNQKAKALAPLVSSYTETFDLKARAVRAQLNKFICLTEQTKALEVGSGAHGLIFFLGLKNGIGLDPLADEYRELFPFWQSGASTVKGEGEKIPFPEACFDLVLSDNVVDHAEDPQKILDEMARVLKPGGLLYFTVNVHHPFWAGLAALYRGLQLLRFPLEVGPFADHTFHFTLPQARRLVSEKHFHVLEEKNSIGNLKGETENLGRFGFLKRWFFKNASLVVIARKH